MKQATISYPEELLEALGLSEPQLTRELTFLAAAKLFETGRLTTSQAARLAGLTRLRFLEQVGKAGAPAINLRGEELEAEIREARKLAEASSGSSTPAR